MSLLCRWLSFHRDNAYGVIANCHSNLFHLVIGGKYDPPQVSLPSQSTIHTNCTSLFADGVVWLPFWAVRDADPSGRPNIPNHHRKDFCSLGLSCVDELVCGYGQIVVVLLSSQSSTDRFLVANTISPPFSMMYWGGVVLPIVVALGRSGVAYLRKFS